MAFVVTFVVFISAVVVCALSQSSVPCPTVKPTTLILSVDGRRNASGHWTKDINMKYEGNKSPDAWDVDFHEDLTNEDSYSFTASAKVQGSVLEDDEEYLPRLRYVYRGDLRNFSDALTVCKQMGASLAVIRSERESQYLVNLVQRSRNPAATHVPYTFVGLYFEDGWMTTDGNRIESSGFSAWEAGQPSNSSFVQNGIRFYENCGTMGLTGLLNDSPCVVRLPFICEFEKDNSCTPVTEKQQLANESN